MWTGESGQLRQVEAGLLEPPTLLAKQLYKQQNMDAIFPLGAGTRVSVTLVFLCAFKLSVQRTCKRGHPSEQWGKRERAWWEAAMQKPGDRKPEGFLVFYK